MTPDELKQFFRDLEIPPRENRLDNGRREAREQEERRFACEREKSRNLTDSEMQRWRDYFHELIASERAPLLSSSAASGTSSGRSWRVRSGKSNRKLSTGTSRPSTRRSPACERVLRRCVRKSPSGKRLIPARS